MFEDSMMESGGRIRSKSRYWMFATFGFWAVVLIVLIVLPLLWWLHGAVRRREGQVFWAFIAGYGAVRTVVEFYREPGIVLFGLTGAQYLTIAMVILGVVMYVRISRAPRIPATQPGSGRV